MRPANSSYDRGIAESLDRAAPVRDRLLAGETVDYATIDDLCDDLAWHDITREHEVEEVAGEGYRLTLAALLRAVRDLLGGIAQREMAEWLGVPMRTYQSWEGGQEPQHRDMLMRALRDLGRESRSA